MSVAKWLQVGATTVALLLAPCAVSQEPELTDQALRKLILKQDQRIRQLEQRIEQLESEAMAGQGEAPIDDEPVIATTGVPASADTSSVSRETGPTGPSLIKGGYAEGFLDDFASEVRETHQLLSSQELVSDVFPSSWPMFGSDMRMRVGGYVKADFVADFDGTLDAKQFYMRTIPVEGTPEYGGDAYFEAFANESRFNIDVRRVNSEDAPLRAFIEGDFFSGRNTLRLRHAYVTAGNFIAGQTWTTLSFLESLPYLIDFAAGDALFGGRAAQLRYQSTINDRWKYSVALEDLQFLGIQNAGNLPGTATSQYPLLAVRADYRYDSGLLLFGGSVGQLHWDGTGDSPSASAMQAALVFAGRHNINERTYASWNFAVTDGGGENILAFAGTGANAVLTPEGELDTIQSISAVLGFGYDWTPSLTSNVGLAYGWLDAPETREDFALERGGIAHTNLIWRPADKLTTGLEFMWGTTEVANGAQGSARRLQAMVKLQF